MSDHGKKTRMEMLERQVASHHVRMLETHNWSTSISRDEDGEYLVIEAKKAESVHRFAVVCSTAIDNKFYKKLENEVEIVFADSPYRVEDYAHGVKVSVKDSEDFFTTLLEWNEELRDGNLAAGGMPRPQTIKRTRIFIQSESPLEQVWSQLRRLESIVLARRLVAQRQEEAVSGAPVDSAQMQSKADGLAYAIRNAADYFRMAPHDNPSQRVLNFYYGTLSFAFAEMLASPTGPSTLSEIEDMTKQGHGLYTIDGVDSTFSGLVTGVLATGFFPKWMRFLGHDTSSYSKQKPKAADQLGAVNRNLYASISEFFARIPELHELYADIFETPPLWWRPSFDSEANGPATSAGIQGKTYIVLSDDSGRTQLDGVKKLPGPLSEFQHIELNEPGIHFRAIVEHPGKKFWFEPLNIHKSPQVDAALIMPVFEGVCEYRAQMLSLLYALSIVVRYRPSLWRRVQEGDWDQYKVLVNALLDTAERILPEHFLEALAGVKVETRQPGSFF